MAHAKFANAVDKRGNFMEHKSTILIVDDHLAGRETLKGLLYGRGYNLVFASDGMEALEKVKETTPDLVLLDVMMPGMDGFEVCQRIRENPRVAEVPVIMVTALDDRDSRLRGIEAGADDFVSKPFDHAELRKRVQTITRLNRYRRLHSERTKFEWVVEQADDGYLVLSTNDIIQYANSKARSYLNFSPESNDVLSKKFKELASQQYNCEPIAAWSVWPGSPTASLPRYLVSPGSATTNPFWLQVDVVEMNVSNTEKYLIRLRDVTLKVAEQRSMWSFHGQVSHKLRTPLNHMFASLDMISEEDLASASPDVQTFFSIAKHGATRLKNEIQDIFQYIETPQIAGSGLGGCKLTEIPKIVGNINDTFELKSIEISFENIDHLENYEVILAQRAIDLILWELLENAKKFHPEKSPSLEILILLASDQLVTIKICDDGLTLAPDQLEKMWVPYYQAEKYFTGQVMGAGLGLSLVTTLIWGVGGSCRSYNRTDQSGIIVELKIPLVS